MNGKIFYRSWYYFRTGWATYFAFIFGFLVKLSKSEKLSDDEIKRIEVVKENLQSYSEKKTLS